MRGQSKVFIGLGVAILLGGGYYFFDEAMEPYRIKQSLLVNLERLGWQPVENIEIDLIERDCSTKTLSDGYQEFSCDVTANLRFVKAVCNEPPSGYRTLTGEHVKSITEGVLWEGDSEFAKCVLQLEKIFGEDNEVWNILVDGDSQRIYYISKGEYIYNYKVLWGEGIASHPEAYTVRQISAKKVQSG